jgi:hypothetical protein
MQSVKLQQQVTDPAAVQPSQFCNLKWSYLKLQFCQLALILVKEAAWAAIHLNLHPLIAAAADQSAARQQS